MIAHHNQAQDRRIAAGLEIPTSLPPVYADERRIQQVFTALVENAIKFTPQGGAITIRAEERHGNVLVSVADIGVGIAPENRQKAFDRFSQ